MKIYRMDWRRDGPWRVIRDEDGRYCLAGQVDIRVPSVTRYRPDEGANGYGYLEFKGVLRTNEGEPPEIGTMARYELITVEGSKDAEGNRKSDPGATPGDR